MDVAGHCYQARNTHTLCVHDLNDMTKLYARAHVNYLPTWSAVAIYAKHAPRACDISSPGTICGKDGMLIYGLVKSPSHRALNGMLILS